MAEEGTRETIQEEETEEVVAPEVLYTIHSAKFEIRGRVQGVYFRKFTVEKAIELGVKGFVRNTAKGRVEGQLQGEEEEFNKMKEWLSSEGSPGSRIDEIAWTEEELIPEYTFPDFIMRA